MFATQKITPYLWFDHQAEEAAAFYTSLFPGSSIISVSRFPEGAPQPAGSVLSVVFELAGQQFVALNGGPAFTFTEAVSFFVNCADQAEVDHYWNRLLDGGQAQQCGWLKDRFGVSWQIIPTALGEMLGDPDPAKAGRTMQAMLQMSKIDIAALRRAYAGH